jgi:hypothetical protein
MLLGASSEYQGSQVELSAVTDSQQSSGIEHGDVLTDLVEAVMRDGEQLDQARAAVLDAVGADGLVDACAIIANFSMLTRVADATGIPLDTELAMITEDMRDALGIDSYSASVNTPRLGRIMRALGRTLAPVVPKLMGLLARRKRD